MGVFPYLFRETCQRMAFKKNLYHKNLFLSLQIVFLGATDLTESPQTNSMRYHKTVFCIQLETKKAQANFSISKIRDFQITEFYFPAISLRISSSFISYPYWVIRKSRILIKFSKKLKKFFWPEHFQFPVECKKPFCDISYGSSVVTQSNLRT